MIDTCQAGSMVLPIKSPNIIGVGQFKLVMFFILLTLCYCLKLFQYYALWNKPKTLNSKLKNNFSPKLWSKFVLLEGRAASSALKTKTICSPGSSTVGQDSLSHHGDKEIGVYVIDRFTYFTLDFLEKVQPNSKATLSDLFR